MTVMARCCCVLPTRDRRLCQWDAACSWCRVWGGWVAASAEDDDDDDADDDDNDNDDDAADSWDSIVLDVVCDACDESACVVEHVEEW